MNDLPKALIAIALLVFIGLGLTLGWPMDALALAGLGFAALLFA